MRIFCDLRGSSPPAGTTAGEGDVFTPLRIDDADAATDAEIIAAYVEDGLTVDEAEAFVSILRGRTSARFVVD